MRTSRYYSHLLCKRSAAEGKRTGSTCGAKWCVPYCLGSWLDSLEGVFWCLALRRPLLIYIHINKATKLSDSSCLTTQNLRGKTASGNGQRLSSPNAEQWFTDSHSEDRNGPFTGHQPGRSSEGQAQTRQCMTPASPAKPRTSFTAGGCTLRLASPVQHDCCPACRRRPAPRSSGTTTTLLALRLSRLVSSILEPLAFADAYAHPFTSCFPRAEPGWQQCRCHSGPLLTHSRLPSQPVSRFCPCMPFSDTVAFDRALLLCPHAAVGSHQPGRRHRSGRRYARRPAHRFSHYR